MIGDQIASQWEDAPAHYGTVAFGTNGSYLYRKMYGPYTCDIATFGGDPAWGQDKWCYAADPIVPAPRAVHFLGDYPHTSTAWSGEVQGIAHSADSWFITQKEMLWKIPLSDDLGGRLDDPRISRLAIPDGHSVSQSGNQYYNSDLWNYNHFGDADVHMFTPGGATVVFVPVQNRPNPPMIAMFDADRMTYVTSAVIPDVPGIDFSGSASWVAVRPGALPHETVTVWVDGVQPVDADPTHNKLVFVSFKFDVAHTLVSEHGGWVVPQGQDIAQLFPPNSYLTSPVIYPLLDKTGQFPAERIDTMQGGDFNEDGTLLYISSGYCDLPGRLHVFNVVVPPATPALLLQDESYNPDDPSFQGGTNVSYVFQTDPSDQICPRNTGAGLFGVFVGTPLNILTGGASVPATYALGEALLGGRQGCFCITGSQEPEGVDYFDTRGRSPMMTIPNVPDSQVHVILGDNGGVTTTWLKHYALDTDLALNGTAHQSSNYLDWSTANLANDGNMDGNMGDGSVMHTNNGLPSTGGIGYPGQYWFVDLGDYYTVDDVVIYNRTDCCQDRLSHFNVLIFSDDADDWVVVSDHSQEDHSQPENLITKLDIPLRVYTRYVMVAKTDDNFLHLAEVQVMGH